MNLKPVISLEIKVIVHPKMKIVIIYLPYVASNPCVFLKRRILAAVFSVIKVKGAGVQH